MSESTLSQKISDLQKELASIQSNSRQITHRIELIPGKAESLKMDILKHALEKRRVAAARQRGSTLAFQDNRKMWASLGAAAIGSVISGLIIKGKYAALYGGLSGFDGAMQGLGEAEWAVSLDNELIVTPCNAIPFKGTWVTFKSLMSAIYNLRMEALQGRRLGNLVDIIQALQQTKGKLVYLISSHLIKRYKSIVPRSVVE